MSKYSAPDGNPDKGSSPKDKIDPRKKGEISSLKLDAFFRWAKGFF
jgi:hypothetical protein